MGRACIRCDDEGTAITSAPCTVDRLDRCQPLCETPSRLSGHYLQYFMRKSLPAWRAPAHQLSALLAIAIVLSLLGFAQPASAQTAPRVAVISRTAPVPPADQAYMDHLREQGWSVTAIDDDRIREFGRAPIQGFDLVVVTSTVYWQRIRWRLRNAPEPIIVTKPETFPGFGMTSFSRKDRGFTKATRKLEIVNPRHPIAAGFQGEITVATGAKAMNYGRVGSGATVIARSTDAAAQAVIFAYGRGDRLASGAAASGPRVGFYMTQELPRLSNRDGWALFDAAAAWASPNAPEGNSAPEEFAPIARNNGLLIGADVAKERMASGYAATGFAEGQVGRKFDIVNRNHEFSAGLTSTFFYDRKHIADGRTVLMSWRATDNPNSTNGTRDPQRARKIVAGQFDKEIEAMAIAMRDLEAPILMMFAWEMDQNAGQPQLIGTPQEFIAAWRYVHGIFQQKGATNVEWVFAPRARSFAKGEGQTFYPGYDYVDWIGGLSVPINSFEDPETIYNAWYQWGVNIGKPQLLWVGLREDPANRFWKSNFIEQIRTLASTQWSGLKAIVYYSNISPLGFDYTIDTSSPALNAFRGLACDTALTRGASC